MRYHLFCAVLFGTSLMSITVAQTGAQGSPPPATNFADAKAQHLAQLQKELACVEASTSFETMRACMPAPPGGHMGPPPPGQR
jgi:hypothetical protein